MEGECTSDWVFEGTHTDLFSFSSKWQKSSATGLDKCGALLCEPGVLCLLDPGPGTVGWTHVPQLPVSSALAVAFSFCSSLDLQPVALAAGAGHTHGLACATSGAPSCWEGKKFSGSSCRLTGEGDSCSGLSQMSTLEQSIVASSQPHCSWWFLL